MISPRELVARLRELKAQYLSDREMIYLQVADAATALMKSRVINRRINASGDSFGTYDPKTIARKGTRNGSSDQVNFSDTNRMWSGTGFDGGRGVKAALIKPLSESDTKVEIIIQPENDPQRQEVLGFLENRFGDIVEWSESELETLINIWNSLFNKLKSSYGF